MDVASAEVTGSDPAELLEPRLVRRLEIGAAAYKLGADFGNRVHNRTARRARGDALGGIELRKRREQGLKLRLGNLLRGCRGAKLFHLSRAGGEERIRLGRDGKRRRRIVAKGLFEPRELVRAERSAVDLGGVEMTRTGRDTSATAASNAPRMDAKSCPSHSRTFQP